jgi:hypothetical protein
LRSSLRCTTSTGARLMTKRSHIGPGFRHIGPGFRHIGPRIGGLGRDEAARRRRLRGRSSSQLRSAVRPACQHIAPTLRSQSTRVA